MKDEDKILEDQAWARMVKILQVEIPEKSKKRFTLWWWLGFTILFVVSVFGVSQLLYPAIPSVRAEKTFFFI